MEYHYHIPIISLSFPYHFHIISLEEPYEPWITWARHIHLWILHPAAPPAPSWQTLGLVCGQPGQETSDINWIIYMYVLLSWCIHKHNYMTYIYIYMVSSTRIQICRETTGHPSKKTLQHNPSNYLSNSNYPNTAPSIWLSYAECQNSPELLDDFGMILPTPSSDHHDTILSILSILSILILIH